MARHVGGLLISRYADGELAPALAERLEAHLVDCAACRGRLHEDLSLGAELRSHFAAVAPSIAAAPVRPARRPLRYAALAAAAVILGVVASPRLVGDTPSPIQPSAGVNAFAAGLPQQTGQVAPVYTALQGFVVAEGTGQLTLRVGVGKVRIDLPSGVPAKDFPVGSAVIVRGIAQANGNIEAASIQSIAP